MNQHDLAGTFVIQNTNKPLRFEASWQRMGKGARWRAFIWSVDGELVGSPGGMLLDASSTDIAGYVQKVVQETAQRAYRRSALGRPGEA